MRQEAEAPQSFSGETWDDLDVQYWVKFTPMKIVGYDSIIDLRLDLETITFRFKIAVSIIAVMVIKSSVLADCGSVWR